MRIIYVMMQYPLGTQTFAISDISTLRHLGHEVQVECLLPATGAQRELVSTYQLDRSSIRNATLSGYLLGMPLVIKYVVENPGLFWGLFREVGRKPRRLMLFLVLLPRIAELVWRTTRHPADVVHAFWGHWPSVVPALLNRYAPTMHTSMHMGAYDLYAGFPLALTADSVDSCFTHSASNLPRIKEMGVTKQVHMIHRGIPVRDLLCSNSDNRRTEKVRHQFCTASALTKSKHVDVSLRIFCLLKRQIPGARLVIVGDGPERAALEQLADQLGIADAVSFAGYLKRQQLFEVMTASECFLFFSQKVSERLPNVVKEAMLAKCVCFVSNTQGIGELIPSSDYGLIFDESDHEAVASKIFEVVGDERRMQDIADKAHSLVDAEFSADSAMVRYLNIWGLPLSDARRTSRPNPLIEQ